MTRNVYLLFAFCLGLVICCQLAENAGVEHENVCIDLSPDGKTLVFSSADGDLFLYDIAKSSATRLTDTDRIESFPSFSADGKRIAFAASERAISPSRICVFHLEDRSIDEVTAINRQADILTRFTPDGKRIVFARSYRKRPTSLGGWTWDMWDVCSIGTNGTGFSRLTNEGYDQLYRVVPRNDGTYLYAADAIGQLYDSYAALFSLGTDSKPTKITELGKSNVAWAQDPMVAPDGTTLAFCSDRKRSFWYDVCVETDAAELTGLVGAESRYNRYPDPDGQRILFLAGTKFNSGNRPIYSLWEVSLSGKTKELATSDLFTNPTNWLSKK